MRKCWSFKLWKLLPNHFLSPLKEICICFNIFHLRGHKVAAELTGDENMELQQAISFMTNRLFLSTKMFADLLVIITSEVDHKLTLALMKHIPRPRRWRVVESCFWIFQIIHVFKTIAGSHQHCEIVYWQSYLVNFQLLLLERFTPVTRSVWGDVFVFCCSFTQTGKTVIFLHKNLAGLK